MPGSSRPTASITVDHKGDSTWPAALYVGGSALMFAAMGASVKVVSAELSTPMVVFFRSLFGLIVVLPLLYRSGSRQLATRHTVLHVARAVTGLTAMACFFFAIRHLRLGEAVLLSFSAPLFIPWFALLWLREPIARGVGWAAVVGFIGVAFVLKPDGGILQAGALVGLAAGAFAALAMICVRRLTRTEPPLRVVFYYSSLCTLFTALPLPWVWETPEPPTWIPLMGMGLFATLGQLLLTRGYALAPAARVGPFSYLAVLFSALLGWSLWGETPDATAALGAILICAAGILAVRRTRTMPV